MSRQNLVPAALLVLWTWFCALGILATAPVAALQTDTGSVAQGVTILSSTAYQSGNYLYVVGEVRNDTAGNVRFIRVTATYYDGGGGVLGTTAGYAWHSILVPGQKSAFRVLREFPVGYASYQLAVSYSTTGETPIPQLLIRSVRQIPSSLGWLHYVGELENTTESNLEFVEVFLVLYDASGNVQNVENTYVFIDVLKPGQRGPFGLFVTSGPMTYSSRAFSTDADLTTAQPPDLRSINVTYHVDSLGWLHFAGEVENLGASQVEFVEAFLTLYDAQGNIVNYDRVYTDPYTIGPGSRAPFEITFLDYYQGWTSYSLYPPEAGIMTPTATASPTRTETPTLTWTPSPTPTRTPTLTFPAPSATPSATPTRTPTCTTTPTPTSTAAAIDTATPTVTPSSTQTPGLTATGTLAGPRVYLPILVRRTVGIS